MPIDEASRLDVLRSYAVLDTPADAALDRITALACLTLEAPIALISLVDDHRQWFLSRQGLNACETSRELAFCAHALPLDRGEIMVVQDAAADPRFARNPLVTGEPNIRFYAGAVLTSPEGLNLGTLCVIDTKPRPHLTALQGETLRALARLVLAELEVNRGRRRDEIKSHLLGMAEAMSGVGHWRLDAITGAVSWSEEVYRIHGVDRSCFDPQLDSALGFYDERDRRAVEDHLARAMRDGHDFSIQMKLRRPNGEHRTVVSRATCERGGNGEVIAVFGVFQDITEHANLLRQVTEDRERLRLLTDNATDVIATYRPDGSFTYLSPAIEKLVGRTAEELVGQRTYAVIDPQDHERVTSEFAALVASGQASGRIEYRALHRDGSTVWVEAHPRPTYGAEGRLTGFQDVVRDVSARRSAEEAVREAEVAAREALARAQASEARYRLLAENANDMISTSTLDSTLTFVTPAVRRLLGYEPEELIGRKTMDLTHPDDLPMVKALFRALVVRGPTDQVSPYQFRGLHKSGAWVWLEGQPRVQFAADGTPLVFQDVVRDIGERRHAEETAKLSAQRAEEARAVAADSERRYRLLAENASDMITRCSLSDDIRFISPSCESILGYTSEELIGTKTLALIHPDDVAPLKARYAAYLAQGPDAAQIEMQFRVRRKDGAVIWLEGRPKIVFDEGGRAQEVYDIMRDITLRKALEAELEEARLGAEAGAQAKADFLANMSHELRTPLTAVVGFSDLAARQDLSHPASDYVRRIGNASKALLSTVNDILDFSKLEAGQVSIKPAPTDVRAACEAAVELFAPQASAKDLTLAVRLTGQAIPPLLLDPDRLRQVLLNMIGNAVKFTDRGEVRVDVGVQGKRLMIAIQDTGPGIAPEAAKQLFQRFSQVDGSSTRAHGGTGLGLAICKGLVEAMGGRITLRSRAGHGSRFTVFLPAVAAAASTAPSPLSENLDSALPAGLRVLVVDDHPVNRGLARLILEGAQAEVSEAGTGQDALDALAKVPFDVVLLDLHMPDADGLSVLKTVRGKPGPNDSTPVVAYTADAQFADRLMASGFDGVAGKPISPSALLRAVACAFTLAPPDETADAA